MINEKIERVAAALKANRFDVVCLQTQDEAKEYLLGQIPNGASAGFGGSVTIDNMGIYETLKEKGCPVYWHWKCAPGEKDDVIKNAMFADYYLCSANAVTEDGRIVNIDGNGNRVAATLLGHKRLFFVVGRNKIVRNYEEARVRIKNVACPLNARRLHIPSPCAKLDHCISCDSDYRICKATLILERPTGVLPTTVILVDEDLGF